MLERTSAYTYQNMCFNPALYSVQALNKNYSFHLCFCKDVKTWMKVNLMKVSIDGALTEDHVNKIRQDPVWDLFFALKQAC